MPLTRSIKNRRNELEIATTVRAVLKIHAEHPAQELCPAHPRAAPWRLHAGLWIGGRVWQHLPAQPGIGRQHPVESRQVQSRSWHQGCQPLQELQGCEFEVTGAVPPGGLERQDHVAPGTARHPLVRKGRTGDVTA